MTQLKILHIASGDLWAGAECQIYTLCKTLNQRTDMTVAVVCMNQGILEEKLQAENIQVKIFDENVYNSFTILKLLCNFLTEYNPDIIHTHRQKENVLGSLANLLSIRAKSVRTTHGAPEFIHKGIKSIHKKCYSALDTFCGAYLQDAVICVTQELKQLLTGRFSKEKLHTIYNGIEFHDTSSVRQAKGNCFKIGMAGRIVPVKRVDIFLQIAVLVTSQNTGDSFEFHIFGDGPLLYEMKTLSENNHLSDTVTFHGHVDNMRERLQDLDLLLMCSDHEGMPMIALEAISSGVPVLSHGVGGLIDLLKTDNNDFLVLENLPENYIEKIQNIKTGAADANLKDIISLCRQKYSADYNAEQTVNLYRLLCNAN